MPLRYVQCTPLGECISNYYCKMSISVHLYRSITARLCWHVIQLLILKNHFHVRGRGILMRPSIYQIFIHNVTESKTSYNWILSLRYQLRLAENNTFCFVDRNRKQIEVAVTFLHISLSLFEKNWQRCDSNDIVETWVAMAGNSTRSQAGSIIVVCSRPYWSPLRNMTQIKKVHFAYYSTNIFDLVPSIYKSKRVGRM